MSVGKRIRLIAAAIVFLCAASAPSAGETRAQSIDCTARTIYFEARGERIPGQVQVGHTIARRVERLGKSPCAVVHQPHQYSWLKRAPRQPKANDEAWINAQAIAPLVLSGAIHDPLGATCYDDRPHPEWGPLLGRNGRHYFYDCLPAVK